MHHETLPIVSPEEAIAEAAQQLKRQVRLDTLGPHSDPLLTFCGLVTDTDTTSERQSQAANPTVPAPSARVHPLHRGLAGSYRRARARACADVCRVRSHRLGSGC